MFYQHFLRCAVGVADDVDALLSLINATALQVEVFRLACGGRFCFYALYSIGVYLRKEEFFPLVCGLI